MPPCLPQYIPGIVATLALLMINCVRRDDLQGAGGGLWGWATRSTGGQHGKEAVQTDDRLTNRRANRRPPQPNPPPDYDPFDDGGFCRSRFWLFISYMVSFASLVGAVWVLAQHYGAPRPPAGARGGLALPLPLGRGAGLLSACAAVHDGTLCAVTRLTAPAHPKTAAAMNPEMKGHMWPGVAGIFQVRA
jgi:hypothetical protein